MINEIELFYLSLVVVLAWILDLIVMNFRAGRNR